MALETKNKKTAINLALDVGLAAAFVVSLRPFLTGLALHEWLGLALGAALAVHTALHWKWVAGVTHKLLARLPARTRLYYVLDAALLAAFVTIAVSGVALSRTALSLLHLPGDGRMALYTVHNLSSWGTVALLAIKLFLHRRWIANAIRGRVRRVERDEARPRSAGRPAWTPEAND
jgi:hypothetical protein